MLLVIPAMLFGSYCMPFVLVAIWWCLGSNQGLKCAAARCPALQARAHRACVSSRAGHSLLTVSVTEALKKRTTRLRPDPVAIGLRRWNLRGLLTNYSFPSGDTAQVVHTVVLMRLLFAR